MNYLTRLESAALGSIATIGLILTLAPTQAWARDPVSQCPESGQALTGSGGDETRYFPSVPNLATLKPAATSTEANVGSVNLKTGGFSYVNEDLAVGIGQFPARLSLVRTYSSDQNAWGADGVYQPAGPGSPDWRYFGRASTHNLDITYGTGSQVFSGKRFDMVYVNIGYQTIVFQKCASGIYVNSQKDGSRLYADTTFGANGFRMEMRDGTTLFFQRIGVAHRLDCNDANCGVVRRWVAPNGDWADFEYESYFSHVDRIVNPSPDPRDVQLHDSTQEQCIVVASGATECKYVYRPWYLIQVGDSQYYTNNGVSDVRLTKITTSRNYQMQFSYVDSSTDIGNSCVWVVPVGLGSLPIGTYCTQQRNYGFARNRIASVKIYSVESGIPTTLLQQTSYTYQSRDNGGQSYNDHLFTYTAPNGGLTRFLFDETSLKIFSPIDAVTPITTVSFTPAPAGNFYKLPVDMWESGFTEIGTRYYDRVASQSFPDGRVIQYTPEFKKKWVARWIGISYPDWVPADYISKMTVTGPSNALTIVQFDDENGPVSVTDPLNRTTLNTYDATGALVSTTNPEGDKVEFVYDVRGNITQTTRLPKAGSALAPLVTSTTYYGGPTLEATDCSNQKLCNRPISTTDARGASTSYVWDTASGMLSSATGPADTSGVSPLTSYVYTGYPSPDGSQIRLLTATTERISAVESVTSTFGYDAANRFFPREITRSSGGVSLRICMKFDLSGNLISQTAPKANLPACP